MFRLFGEIGRGFTWRESLVIGFATSANIPLDLVIDGERLREASRASEQDRAIRKLIPRDADWTVEIIEQRQARRR